VDFFTRFLQILMIRFGNIGSYWGSNYDLVSSEPRRKFIVISKKVWCSFKIYFSLWNWKSCLKWSFSTFRMEPCWRFGMCVWEYTSKGIKTKSIETNNWISKHSYAFTVIKYGVNVLFCSKNSFSVSSWRATGKGDMWLQRELVNILSLCQT